MREKLICPRIYFRDNLISDGIAGQTLTHSSYHTTGGLLFSSYSCIQTLPCFSLNLMGKFLYLIFLLFWTGQSVFSWKKLIVQ